jgi:hypothetical protein
MTHDKDGLKSTRESQPPAAKEAIMHGQCKPLHTEFDRRSKLTLNWLPLAASSERASTIT